MGRGGIEPPADRLKVFSITFISLESMTCGPSFPGLFGPFPGSFRQQTGNSMLVLQFEIVKEANDILNNAVE